LNQIDYKNLEFSERYRLGGAVEEGWGGVWEKGNLL
jgi:hypothetical protein